MINIYLYQNLVGNAEVELDLSNYAASKSRFFKKTAIVVDTLKCAKKVDLTSLKSGIDKLVIGKLETAPVGLSKLSDVGKK